MQSELTGMIDTYTLIGKHCMAKNTGPSMFYLTLTELLEKNLMNTMMFSDFRATHFYIRASRKLNILA